MHIKDSKISLSRLERYIMEGGKTAYYAREENEHDRTVQHRGIHEIYLGVGAYHHYCQGTSGMCVGEAEHKQGTTLQLLGQETHQIGGNPFG